MIALDTTVPVWFYVMTNDGLPATGQANNITAFYTVNVGAPFNVTDTIREYDSTVLPGWYYFTHTFNRQGTHFVVFSCPGCVIQPWEDTVVSIADAVWVYGSRSLTDARIENTNFRLCYDSDLDTVASFVWNYSTMLNPASAWDTLISRASADNITSATSTVKTYGDSHWVTATGFAIPSDIPSVQTIQAGLATSSALGIVNTTINAIKAKTDNLPANPAASSDIPSTSTIATAVWSDTATYSSSSSKGKKLSKIALDVDDLPTKVWCADLSSFSIATTAGYQVFTALGGCATSSQLTSAQTAIIAAIPDISNLSTFDPTNDTVLIDPTQAAGMTTATGFATATDVSNAETAIIAAIPTVPTDYAKVGDTMALSSADINSIRSGLATGTDVSNAQSAVINAMPDVSGLSTFDATTDTVLIDATQAATMETATGFATPADIPSPSAVAEAVWDTDLTDITASDTAAKQIYTALSNCATATDTAVLSAELDEILGGVLHWSVNYNTLTVYRHNNTPIRTYSITRDENGNIAQLTPNG